MSKEFAKEYYNYDAINDLPKRKAQEYRDGIAQPEEYAELVATSQVEPAYSV